MAVKNLVIHTIPAIDSALCALMSSYTFISILDHERWMKEWGDEHEAVAVMHLRTPILSAAFAMGLGGITTVHQVALACIRLDGRKPRTTVLHILLCTIVATATMFAMLYVARKDAYAGVDRVECLKKAIHKRHTLTELKKRKGLGRKVAYFSQLEHIGGAGVILAAGILCCWALNVQGLSGNFFIVFRPLRVIRLAVSLLVFCSISCWLLFRVLVWKPAHEEYRPLCALFFAASLWVIDILGKTDAIRYDDLQGRVANGSTYGWTIGSGGGSLLLVILTFFAVFTQYAIALELRVAYCGLQDANLDLQMIAGGANLDENSNRSLSAVESSGRKRRRGTMLGSRSPARKRAQPPPLGLVPISPRIKLPTVTLAMTADVPPMKPPTGVMTAILRMSPKVRPAPAGIARSIRVQPVGAESVYEVSVSDCEDGKDGIGRERPLSGASVGGGLKIPALGECPIVDKMPVQDVSPTSEFGRAGGIRSS